MGAQTSSGAPTAPALYPDDPKYDATDAAHPAWWRGHEHGAASAARALAKLLVTDLETLAPPSFASAEMTELAAGIIELRNEVKAHLGALAALAKIEGHKQQCLVAFIQGQTKACADLLEERDQARQIVRDGLARGLDVLGNAGLPLPDGAARLVEIVRAWDG